MKNISTKFPSEIDERVCFSDVSIEQIPIMKEYCSLLENKSYTKASELLNNSKVFFYGAWCLNLLENRLYAIGNYVMDLNINLVNYSNSEPVVSDELTTWIL